MMFPDFDPVIFSIGPIALRWYSLAYIAGLLLGWFYIRRLLATPHLWAGGRAPMAPMQVDDLLVWVTLGVILGGRLGHVLFYNAGYYFSHPLEILQVWNGGMSFHGGLLGTVIAMMLFARRNGLVLFSIGDLVAAAVPFGLFFGRIANFINGEIVGSPTTMPWGIIFPEWGPEPRHPAMLYEAALEGIALFFVLRHFTHSRGALMRPGLTAGAFLVGYAVFRMVCELFKIVDYRLIAPPLPITKGMVLSVPMLAAGFMIIWIATRAVQAGSAKPRPAEEGA
ncbi:MAG: prolipoprotein diacylglyceryl transferase [Alphaproteobacteria bacterium]